MKVSQKLEMLKSHLAKWRWLGISILLGLLVIRLIGNLGQGYWLVESFRLEQPVKLGTFQSTLKPISMVYPQDWEARDTPGGYHNDKEAIVMMQIMFHDYPFVRIRSQPMPEATLTDVAAWGEKRILDGLFRESTYKTAPLEPIELNGHPALRRSFEYKLFDTITCQQIYLLDDEDAYTIELCIDLASDSPEVQQLFTEMIESIKLNSPS